jgi:hypothetical protein
VKDFSSGPGRLRVLSVGAKLLYTAFVVATLVGLLVSWRLYGSVVSEAGPRAYYSGAPVAAKEEASGGPQIDLADSDKPRAMVVQISDRKLLEVTHFHLFSVPVYVLILAHLWLLARMPRWLQTGGVVAAIATSALHLAAPWLVRSSPGTAWLMPVSGAAMLVTMAIIGGWPTVDMWLPRRAGRDAEG